MQSNPPCLVPFLFFISIFGSNTAAGRAEKGVFGRHTPAVHKDTEFTAIVQVVLQSYKQDTHTKSFIHFQ